MSRFKILSLILFAISLFAAVPSHAQTSQIPLQCKDTSGSGTAQSCPTVLTLGPVSGDSIIYTTTTANTGDVTVNVDGKGPAHIMKWSGSSTLSAGDLPANIPVQLIFDGINWELQVIGNAPTGLGNVIAPASFTQGEPASALNSSVNLHTSPAYLDCSAFYVNDWTLALQTCLQDLYALNHYAGVADMRGVPGTTGSVNPYAAASNIPASGRVLYGPGVYFTPVPLVRANHWIEEGIPTDNSTSGAYGTIIEATGTFPAAYSTGTVTVGTVGAGTTITGSGTNWTATNVEQGCAIMVGLGATNSFFGVITNVNTGTQTLTVGWGHNNGTGTTAGASYTTDCAVETMGSGASTSSGDQSGMATSNLEIEGNGLASTGYRNWYGNQGTWTKGVTVHGATGKQVDIEWQFQQSGPYEFSNVATGTTCTANTMNIVVRGSLQSFYGIQNTSQSNGNCSTNISQGIDIGESGVSLTTMDNEQLTVGIGIALNPTCVPACAMPETNVGNTIITNAWTAAGTTLIKIGNTLGNPSNTTLKDLHQNGSTNAVVDLVTGCTETNSRMGKYETNGAGNISYSTSAIASCQQKGTQYNPIAVAALPTGILNGYVSVVSDGASSTDCTTGGGSTLVSCRYNGSSWAAISGSGGSAGANTALSNLAAVAVNLALTPGTDASISLDSVSHRYVNSWWSGVTGWTNGSGTADTGLSRCGAALVCVGNGTAGDTTGTLEATVLETAPGANPGLITFPGNTGTPSIGSSLFGILGPSSASFTSYVIQMSSTAPSGTQALECGTPSSNISICSWVTASGAVSSVSNSDSTLTITPTTGAVVASLNLGNANTWTAAQTLTGNIIMNGNDVVKPIICADTSSSATTYTCTTSPSLGSLVTGEVFSFTAVNQNNSGSSTLNIDGIGAKTIKKWQNSANLAANDLQASAAVLLRYDGTNLELDTIGNAPSSNVGTVTSVATSSPLGGGPITSTGTITCATCVTSAASLTSTAFMTGAGSQGSQTPSATATLSSGGAPFFPGSGTFSAAGAASTPGLTVTGAPYTGGSATTNFPQLYINDGTGPTTFNTAGTEFGINTPSGFTGNFEDYHVNGAASVASLNYQGIWNAASYVSTGSTAGFFDYPQGSTSASVSPCNTPVSICEQAPTSVTAYLITKPGAAPTVANSYAATSTGGVQSWASANEQFCGTAAACGATAEPNMKVVFGSAPLASGAPSTVTITGISPAFTATADYVCTVSAPGSTAATALLGVSNVSSSSFTITGPASVTTVVSYICVGF